MDSISNLPLRQRVAVENACEEIEWLLEDEISSALRRQVPITEENLDRVASHICSKIDSKNCVFQKEYFNFVTGLGKGSNNCLLMFFAELDSVSFDYRLKQVGKYWIQVKPNSLMLSKSPPKKLQIIKQIISDLH